MSTHWIFRLCLLQSWLIPLCLIVVGNSVASDQRPNVVWITSEDNSCYLGCYGDQQAVTPNLDRLAMQGIRYRNAFANAPVCSTARSTLITGMHASSLGIHNHRSQVRIPDRILLYPEVMRAAGYYCTNNSKEDYNIQGRKKIWDASSKTAHYRNRAEGQPFFAVFNFTRGRNSSSIFHSSPIALSRVPYGERKGSCCKQLKLRQLWKRKVTFGDSAPR